MSYTTLLGSSVIISPISINVAFGGSGVFQVGWTRSEDVERLWPCCRRRRLKASFKAPLRLLSPLYPSSDPGPEVLPCRRLVKSTSPPFKAWTPPKRLNSTLASNMVQTHQEIRRTITTSTMPAGSLAHSSLLNSSTSRPKAAKNDIVLSANDVRPTRNPTIADS